MCVREHICVCMYVYGYKYVYKYICMYDDELIIEGVAKRHREREYVCERAYMCVYLCIWV